MSEPIFDARTVEPGPKSLRERLAAFPRDDRGDEGVNKVLIIAMIVVPLVIVLIIFGKDIVTFFKKAWEKVKGKSETEGPETGY
jgi:hypothetical protein